MGIGSRGGRAGHEVALQILVCQRAVRALAWVCGERLSPRATWSFAPQLFSRRLDGWDTDGCQAHADSHRALYSSAFFADTRGSWLWAMTNFVRP